MPVKALFIRVPKMTNYIAMISKAPKEIKGERRNLLGHTFPAVFTRVWMSEDSTMAIYITMEQVDEPGTFPVVNENTPFSETLGDA